MAQPVRRRRSNTTRNFIVWVTVLAVFLALVVLVTASITNLIGSGERGRLQQQVEEMRQQVEQMQQQMDEKQQQWDAEKAQYEQDLSSLRAQLAAKKKIFTQEETPVVYLTFDDGPSDNTLKILDILKESGVTATFFVMGTSKIEYVQNIADAGCAVGLHTDTHDYAQVYISEEGFFNDLTRVGEKVKAVLGYTPNITRFPGGSSNTVSKKYNAGIMTRLTKEIEARGYSYWDWNCDSTDASGNHVAPDKLVESVKKQTGSQQRVVVLMHDTGAKDTTVEALPRIIQFFKDNGYRFGKLSADLKPIHHGVNN